QRQEGDTVTVGEVLGTLEAGEGEALADNPEAAPDPAGVGAAPSETTTEPASQDVTPPPPAKPADVAPEPAVADAPASDDGSSRAAPAVKRMAEEYGINLAAVAGSGPGGRITRDDLLGHLAKSSTPAQADAPAPAAATPAPTPAP